MHLSLFRTYLQIISDLLDDCKVIITSHSPYVISFMDLDSIYVGIHQEGGVAEFHGFKKSKEKMLEDAADSLDMGMGDYIFSMLSNNESGIEGYLESDAVDKCLVLFLEGQTEVEFYKALIKYIRECRADKKLEHKVICRSIDGIGGYKKEVNRILLKEVMPKVEGYQITVALCYDTDVFGYVQKPKINWKEVEKLLKNNGAYKVLHIKAEKSIEDWFLLDKNGIKKFLKLGSDIEPQGPNGYGNL